MSITQYLDVTYGDPDNGTIMTVTPASDTAVTQILEAKITPDGRSAWKWFRMPNGDLIFGCYPCGDLYLELSEMEKV